MLVCGLNSTKPLDKLEFLNCFWGRNVGSFEKRTSVGGVRFWEKVRKAFLARNGMLFAKCLPTKNSVYNLQSWAGLRTKNLKSLETEMSLTFGETNRASLVKYCFSFRVCG